MRARIWGCRGSLPAPSSETVRYGGNTSCVELNVDDDVVIVLDAGSGMRQLGRALEGRHPRAIHVLLTHLHLDHLQGLAFFLPFWSDDAELHIWGPSSPNYGLAERVASYVSPPLFPVHLSDVPSRPVFHDVPDRPWMIGSALVAGYPVVHQGPTLGFRVTADDRTLAYIPDHEPSLGVDLEQLDPDWISGYRVAHGADVLLHDSQYSGDEYDAHVGWGHSSIGHALTFARAAEVERLVMFHHDPGHTDTELESLRDEAEARWTGPQSPILAAEGMTLVLDQAGVSVDPPAPTWAARPPVLTDRAGPS
ncbi:MAG TPA: MBL fold metallo-hydrolase [Acidimicrobiales bacterium]|nr:MBL fold metallo-hydrolase [Acidimicrobiales bacterium]